MTRRQLLRLGGLAAVAPKALAAAPVVAVVPPMVISYAISHWTIKSVEVKGTRISDDGKTFIISLGTTWATAK